MNRNRMWVIMALVGLIAFAVSVPTWARVFSARPEPPLAEMALQKNELPEDAWILSAGPVSLSDVSHPINTSNGLAVPDLELVEAYGVSAVSFGSEKTIEIGHYLYRYRNVAQVEAQAKRMVDRCLQDAQRGCVVNVDEAPGIGQGMKGWIIRAPATEGEGYYSWSISIKGNTLILLVVGGVPHELAKATFESLKARVQQR